MPPQWNMVYVILCHYGSAGISYGQIYGTIIIERIVIELYAFSTGHVVRNAKAIIGSAAVTILANQR